MLTCHFRLAMSLVCLTLCQHAAVAAASPAAKTSPTSLSAANKPASSKIKPAILTPPSAVPAAANLRLPDLSALTPPQRDLFDQIASDEFCGCDSALTLRGCLNDRPSCQLANDIGQVLGKIVGAGAPRSAASTFLSQTILGPFCSLPQSIDVQGGARLGPKEAQLKVVEFFDYRCTHCRAAMPLVHQALKELGNQVSLTVFPVAMVDNSPSSLAAEAALAALAQNKFWPMHRQLFAHEAMTFTQDQLRDMAKAAGLDTKRFANDMLTHAHAATLKQFMQRFAALGLEGTPAFFVNERKFDMEPRYFSLRDRLQMELDRHVGQCQ